MDDQAERGQILRLTEEQAKARCPNLTVASLGVKEKEKSTGDSTARVFFDGTHGIRERTHRSGCQTFSS